MRAAGDKAAARRVEDEDRVVYRDLVEPAGARSLLFSPDPPRRPGNAAETSGVGVLARPKGIFHQQPLFHLDGSGDEGGAGESEDENPFASLLQSRPATPPRDGDGYSPGDSLVGSSMRSTEAMSTEERSDSQLRASTANVLALPSRERVRDRRVSATQKAAASKRLSFEAADSRPARWGARPSKPSAKDAQNRRKSLDAIRLRQREGQATGSTRQRPAALALKGARSSLDDVVGGTQASEATSFFATKKPRLSEVLHRATMLSQHKAEDSPAAHSQPISLGSPVDHDAILDTDQQMKAEPFSPPIFSPSRSNEAHAGRKQRQGGAALNKLRGDIGEAVRKAVRRTNRDLTLLRADGQSLLAQQGGGSSNVVERIQNRGHVIVCLRAASMSGQHTFECSVHSTTPDVEESCPSGAERVQVVLSPHTVDVVKAAPGVVLRIFAPFHFVPRQTPAGSTAGTKRWFLIGTQLAEAVERDHVCSL